MGSGQSKPSLDTASSTGMAPSTNTPPDSSGGGCPMKNSDGSYRIMPGFSSLFGRHPRVATSDSTGESTPTESTDKGNTNNEPSSGCPVRGPSRVKALSLFSRSGPGPDSPNLDRQQYDVYSRPLELDPNNNMPLVNPDNLARNNLPSKEQTVSLPTERASSTIPKGGTANDTWTYPSPQMFWNSLSRKGKLGDTKEEDMETVVAIHNSMNESTWGKVLEWEDVLGHGMPKLSRFIGRPHDLSPKAFIKHHILSHPLPFDRHDWTVLRPSGEEVRYVIDYYHDTAREGDDTTIEDLQIGNGGKVNSLLVDVRPALDTPAELWGRMVSMPLARRGCASIVDCILSGGKGNAKISEFEPLPMMPSETLRTSMDESKEVWATIQKNANQIEGADACDSTTMDEHAITEPEAIKIAESYAKILEDCQDFKAQLKNCGNDADCRKAFMGMTVCAGKVMCPLQHKSFVDTLDVGEEVDEMASAKINIAFDTLGECVAGSDKKASSAKRQYPDVFKRTIGK